MTPTVFGVRHHGPGCARSLRRGLEALGPDCVLVEGPADAGPVLGLASDAGMQPPVALLAYASRDPARCVFYPFAGFSPEWQAVRWALAHDVELRFIDLPSADVLAQHPGHRDAGPAQDGAPEPADAADPAAPEPGDAAGPAAPEPADAADPAAPEPATPELLRDPLSLLARSAGYEDAERWWEDMVEYRADDLTVFAAVSEAMAALREQLPEYAERPHERRREAHMVAQLRRAQRQGFARIAVVCGAWHAPVLAAGRASAAPPGPKPIGKTVHTWVPWSYDRLAVRSGYGAGVVSPGWYEHLFEVEEQPVVRWLGRVARLMREHDTDVSTAHIIETARTAEALCALRGRPQAGLEEITDALRAVLGEHSETMLSLLHERLVIGQRLGQVAERVPTVPLQRDLEAAQRAARLKPEAAGRALELDLRKPLDLGRSLLLHRLRLLDIPWGAPQPVSGARGTFREAWTLQWHPEFAVRIVEASGWGTTVPSAATASVRNAAGKAPDLAALTHLLEASLLADLPDAVSVVLVGVAAQSALSTDLPALMAGLPALARAARYGSVRQTDVGSLATVVRELVARISVGLPPAAAHIDDEAATTLVARTNAVDAALHTLDEPSLGEQWHDALRRTGERSDAHPLIAGRACRLLRDHGVLDADEVTRRMDLVLSPGTPTLPAASWLEGFLTGSGLAVIHDADLLGLVDRWLTNASADGFQSALPILRRTFASFSAPERRQIGERVRAPVSGAGTITAGSTNLDPDRAALVLPVLRELLGVKG